MSLIQTQATDLEAATFPALGKVTQFEIPGPTWASEIYFSESAFTT
jgi:hypothetical protein